MPSVPDPPDPAGRRPGSRDRWLGVDTRHLAALGAVAEYRSFSTAADRLGYVQSAVSQQILHLERVVGARLFERGKGPQRVVLTDAGQVLLAHVQRILGQLREAQSELDGLVAADDHRLVVGIERGVGTRLLPDLTARFASSRGRVELVMRPVDADVDLSRRVEDGTFAAAIGDLPPQSAALRSEVLFADPFVLVVRAGAPLSDHSARLEDLVGHPFIGHHATRMTADIETELERHGVAPDVVFRSSEAASLQALVAAGTGVAVAPRSAVEGASPAIRTIVLPGLAPRSVSLAWRADRDDDELIEALRVAARAAAEAMAG